MNSHRSWSDFRCFCVIVLIALAMAIGAVAQPAPSAKNIVLIVADDLDVASLNTMISAGMMPKLQHYIISRGASFTEAFVSDARGCPSRFSLLRGQYFHNFRPSDGRCGVAVVEDGSTLATWLRTAGYRTALIGRYNDGYGYTDINRDGVVDGKDATYVPPGWENWQAFVFPAGPGWTPPAVTAWWENANMYNYSVNDNGVIVRYGSAESAYQTDVLANRAADYISQQAGGNKPFFLLLAGTAPHVEVFPDVTTVDEYQDAWRWDIRPAVRHTSTTPFPLPTPVSFNEADVSDKPAWMQAKPQLTSTDITNLTKQYQHRLASLRAVDDMIGKVGLALETAGQLSNTVLIFTSDNGWLMGQHRLAAKMLGYEESIRVPLYISLADGPKTIQAMVTQLDITATIAGLAGVQPGLQVDGVSLVPLIQQPAQPWRKRLLIESWAPRSDVALGPFDVPAFLAVRTSPEAPNVPSQLYLLSIDRFVEFYDLPSDPAELTNLGADPSPGRAKQRGVHSSWMNLLRTCNAGSCQAYEFQ
jgi:arylsulfatase A-like enzyme